VAQPAGEPSQPVVPTTKFAPGVLFSLRRLPLTLLAALVALLFVRLGFWQLDRRAQRLAYNARIEQRLDAPPLRLTGPPARPEDLAFRYATVSGSFDYDHEIVLQNRSRGGQAGVHVLTPLRIAGSDTAVLVDRGWLPDEAGSPTARARYRGPAAAQVRGLAQIPPQRPARGAPAGQRGKPLDAWFMIDLPAIQQQMPYQLLPFYLEQSPEQGAPELPWRSETIMLDEGPHLGYAIQWFTFAIVGVVGYIAVGGRREVIPSDPSRQG
jgi:surfeit locus 1 family protein